jgi:hypothetical protein
MASVCLCALTCAVAVSTAQAATVDQYPISETAVYGTLVSGSYTSATASDNVYETLREVMNGTSYSWMEWKWTFNIRAGTAQQFRVEAYRPSNSDSDNFQFAYSTNGSSYTNMVSITKTSDNNTDQTYSLPAGTTGTVYVRVRDTNRTSGRNSLDTLYIDRMCIRTTYTDTTPPAAVTNLAAGTPTTSSLTLTWTAPGDDGSTGTATSYDIRYSTSTITDANWASATQVTGEPTPAVAGTNQNMGVSGLSTNTTYYFAMKTADAVPNWSAISNSPSGTTSGTITFVNNTLTYGSPSDLGTTIDPTGLNEVATSYGITKAAFQALTPQVVAFNGAPAPTQTLRTLVAYYSPADTVTFTFPAAMYNYGSMTTVGRGAFSGASLQDAISTVPSTPDSLNDWFDATITSTGGQGVKALGMCVAFRNDQAVPAGQVLYTLSDATTDSVSLPALGGGGNPEYVFIGYQAPTGKTISRVQASRASTVGGAWVSVDDLSFVMAPLPDTTPPAAVSNLAAGSPTAGSLNLTWTAPGDDNSTGTAASYDIRYSTSTINDANWASATQVSGEPTPAVAGTNQNMTVSGLSGDTTHYFAMKTSDEVPNVSAISNVPSAKTSDTVTPAAVSNLATGSITASSITLSWTAPGDNGSTGTATSYDIRYRTGGAVDDSNWASATQVSGEPTPAVAGTNQNMTVSGLSGDTTHYFAMKTSDEVPNVSAISNVPSAKTSDTVAPAAAGNLATGGPTVSSITLTWTAPGDNGSTGTAASYDIRYRTGGAVDDSNWASATQVTGEPTPAVAGTNQNMVVSGLSASTTYYFAIKTSDEVPNISAISNSPSGTTSTPPDTTAPAAVSNLAASNPTTSSITLTWTAPGDDGSTGTAAIYDIRYRTGGAVDESNWASATQVTAEPTPAVAGTNQNMVVSGLSASTTYYFAIKTSDEVPNISAISNSPSGTTSAPPAGAIVALKRDAGLTAGGATDARFNGATVRTVTVSDAGISNPGDSYWYNGGGATKGSNYTLYRFDLSTIPTGSTVNLAQLRIYHTMGNGALGNGDVSKILTHSWLEGTANYTFPGAAGGVSSAHPIGYNTGPNQNASGGTSAPLQSWGPSSDAFFSLTVDAGSPITPSSAPSGVGYTVIDVTSHVQAWVNATSPNYGWAQPAGNWDFHCSEAGTSLEPVLFVDYGAGADTTAPAAVSNLAAGSPTSSSITLTWTAPGDDGNTGTAASYDIRYRTGGAVDDSNWTAATQVTGEPTPAAAGTNQNMVVSGLAASTTYYFAIKTSDEVPNTSAVSNSPSGTTQAGSGNNKPILGQSDFVYQGYYIVQRDGNYNNMAELNYGQGFTHRYVSGQLRFLTYSFFGNVQGGGDHLIEFAPPAGGLGGTITNRTNHWADIFGSTGMAFGNGVWGGLWYEQSQERLWTTWAVDYPDDTMLSWTKTFVVRTLNSDGTVSNVQGPWGLQGIGQRRIYGGVVAIPSWFQSTYGAAAYGAGWGGYSSRMAQGLSAALGPTFYTFPEPTGYPVGDIPTSAFKTIMDHGDGIYGADWYPNGSPTSFDRGVRNTDVDNDYDAPYWQSPAPDGLGRWTWGDSNWNTGCWIETPTKQGFILIPKLCNGRTWYETSTLHCERQSAEIQVYDPNLLGQVTQGTRAKWNTYPTNRWEITSTLAPLGFNYGRSGNGPDGGPAGASYDSTTQTLYIYCIGGSNWNSYILVYHVN